MATDQTEEDMRLPRRRELPHTPVAGEVMVHDPATGQVHFLNTTAATVWNCCDGRTTLVECVERLRTRFDSPGGVDVAADVRELLDEFTERGLLDL